MTRSLASERENRKRVVERVKNEYKTKLNKQTGCPPRPLNRVWEGKRRTSGLSGKQVVRGVKC